MNEITIRKSVNSKLAQHLGALTNDAIYWMIDKYPHVDFTTVEFIFSSSYRRSRYYRNAAKCAKYVSPNACISTRAILMLYDMKTLNIKKRRIFVGSNIQIMCALIHELTHHAQYEEKRSTGELETTRNELTYLKEFHPSIYNKMVKH